MGLAAQLSHHDQYPHKSGLQWEELHKGHRSQVKQALSMIEIRMKTQMDATLYRHLGSDVSSILTTAKSRAGRDDTSVSTLASTEFITQKPRASSSVIVKHTPQASGVIRTKTSSGVATTDKHVENIANFLVQRKEVDPSAGYPTKKEWQVFKEKVRASEGAESPRLISNSMTIKIFAALMPGAVRFAIHSVGSSSLPIKDVAQETFPGIQCHPIPTAVDGRDVSTES
jgi:hypothetical protein